MKRLMIPAAAIALPTAVLGATAPGALKDVTGGMWEISGAPGAHKPIRECIADVLLFAQFEHRTRSCSRDVISDKGTTIVVSYSCGPSDFGQSQIDVITPRSLRVSTQGISDQLPFNYVIQAHRFGDCKSGIPATPH